MRKLTTLVFIGCFLASMIGFTVVGSVRADQPGAAAPATTTISNDFTLTFEKDWLAGDSQKDNTTLPDIADVVAGLTDFTPDGCTAYYGPQVPTMTLQKAYYRVNATYIWVYDGRDVDGAGEIHLRGWVNQYKDDDMDNTQQWDYDFGSVPDGTEGTLGVVLFEGWATYLYGALEWYDDDVVIIESFGTWEFTRWDSSDAGVWDVTYGDAGDPYIKVRYAFEVLSGPVPMTAGDIVNAYKPYLFSDVETTHDDPADLVVGRVIEGYDAWYGKTASCLQYLYYFPYEYTGTNSFVHYWDWEMVYIFVDFNAGGDIYPYRLVWDNGWYFGSGSDTDWIDGQEYHIYERGATPGSYERFIEFSPELWPLLGQNRTMEYKVYDIDAEAFDAGVENWGIFEWGLPTFQGTLDTSYHQFDLGDSGGGPDPADMLRDYTVFEMNASIIQDMYLSLETAWANGIHELSGHYTPNYAPFSWDVMQPFERPYLLNNYPKLCVDMNAFYGAQEQDSKYFRVEKSLKTMLKVPCTLNVTIPKSAKPGETVPGELNFTLHQDKANLTLDFFYGVYCDVKVFYWDLSWSIEVQKSFFIDFGNPVVQALGKLIEGFISDKAFSALNDLLGDYVSVSGTISPKLVGTIVDVTFSVSLYNIIKHVFETYLPTSMAAFEVLDSLIDDVALTINPTLVGYMEMDVTAGGNPVVEAQRFESARQDVPISFTMPTATDQAFQLAINGITYGMNAGVNWGLEVTWGEVTSHFLNDYAHSFGRWPNADATIAEGSATLAGIADYAYDATTGLWVLENAFGQAYEDPADPGSSTGTGDIPGYAPWGLVALVGLTVGIIGRRQSRRNV